MVVLNLERIRTRLRTVDIARGLRKRLYITNAYARPRAIVANGSSVVGGLRQNPDLQNP